MKEKWTIEKMIKAEKHLSAEVGNWVETEDGFKVETIECDKLFWLYSCYNHNNFVGVTLEIRKAVTFLMIGMIN